MMKLLAATVPAVLMLFPAVYENQQPRAKIMNEDNVQNLVMARLGSGRIEFVERKDDDTLTTYEIYLAKSDTLMKVIVNGRSGVFESYRLDPQQGHAVLKARMLAKTRAEKVALEAVRGQVLRWKLKREEGHWYYWFRIETVEPKNKWKNVYIDKDSFEVKKIKTYKRFEKAAMEGEWQAHQ